MIGPKDLYCGRGSIWGNPYSTYPHTRVIEVVSSRKEAIEKHMIYLRNHKKLLKRIPSLEGCRLFCSCKPLSCHIDNIITVFKEIHGII